MQLLDLLLLAPDLQLAVLAVGGDVPMSEWALRAVAHAGSWRAMRRLAWPSDSLI